MESRKFGVFICQRCPLCSHLFVAFSVPCQVLINRNLKQEFESKYWTGLLDAQGKASGDYY